MREDVDWPDGVNRLRGRSAVRDYWAKRWARLHTQDEIVGITETVAEQIAVRISQVVRDLNGSVVSRGEFEHIFQFEGGLVARMGLSKLQRSERGAANMADHNALVQRLYRGFNERNIPSVLALLHDEVDWANGMDGGHVHGREAIRDYWTKQWAAIKPRVDPLRITRRSDDVTAVEVHQVVHDLAGKLLLDEKVRHVFRIEGGLVTRFDIENAGGLSSIAHE